MTSETKKTGLMDADFPLRLPSSLRETIAYVALGVVCLICFISPPNMMLQREQAFKSSLVLVIGLLSWVDIIFYRKIYWPRRLLVSKLLLGIFVAGILLSA